MNWLNYCCSFLMGQEGSGSILMCTMYICLCFYLFITVKKNYSVLQCFVTRVNRGTRAFSFVRIVCSDMAVLIKFY